MSALEVLREMAAKYHRLAREAQANGELPEQIRHERMAKELDAEVRLLESRTPQIDLEDLIGE